MAMSEQDLDRVRLIVLEAVTDSNTKLIALVRSELIPNHQAACPHGKRLSRWLAIILGIGIGLSFALGMGAGFSMGRLVF